MELIHVFVVAAIFNILAGIGLMLFRFYKSYPDQLQIKSNNTADDEPIQHSKGAVEAFDKVIFNESVATVPGIVLFDGVCNMCNGFINALIDLDPQSRLLFASLQSEIGQTLIAKYNIDKYVHWCSLKLSS